MEDDIPEPKPVEGEALVRVIACGVNRIDVWARGGRYKTTLPHILGTDIAGEVVSLGPGAEGPEKGTKVLVRPILSDGTCIYCRRGRPNLCVNRGFVGVATDGGYAELVRVPAASLLPLDGVDAEVAAALPVNFATVWNALVSKASVGEQDTVLVWGAAGGLGHAAVQVAKHRGAKVIAAVGDARKGDFVKALGADYVVDSRSRDFVEQVRSITEGLGASVVFDHVGGDTWTASIDCLARGGRMVVLGLTSGPKSEVDVRRVYQDELEILGAYGQTSEDLKAVLQLAKTGRLSPSIFRKLPLSSAKEAHEIIESREVQGKILLLP